MKNHVVCRKRGRDLDVSVVSVRSMFCPRCHLLHRNSGPRSSDQPGAAVALQLGLQTQWCKIHQTNSCFNLEVVSVGFYLSINLPRMEKKSSWLVLCVGETFVGIFCLVSLKEE